MRGRERSSAGFSSGNGTVEFFEITFLMYHAQLLTMIRDRFFRVSVAN